MGSWYCGRNIGIFSHSIRNCEHWKHSIIWAQSILQGRCNDKNLQQPLYTEVPRSLSGIWEAYFNLSCFCKTERTWSNKNLVWQNFQPALFLISAPSQVKPKLERKFFLSPAFFSRVFHVASLMSVTFNDTFGYTSWRALYHHYWQRTTVVLAWD